MTTTTSDTSTVASDDWSAIQDITKGIKLASLAITDEKTGTLKKVGKAMPWHIQALKMITGSTEKAHRPLSVILFNDMNLHLDCEIDISGITKGGHFLDTQGYIAHNDDTIVLAYRCTTSAFDWLTNFNATSSAWEIEEDLELGYSGFCSGFDGLCDPKPRVHTGFYNNFLASLPLIRKHIEPLLAPDQPPKKLFVVGHSLGAGIATLAGCYFLLHHDWNALPHTLVNVTAGSPRACGRAMKQLVEEKLAECEGSANIFRVVKGKDVVTTVPPRFMGFVHITEPVFIDNDDHIHMHAVVNNSEEADTDQKQVRQLLIKSQPQLEDETSDEDMTVSEKELKREKKYERMVKCVPRSLRDHMPDFYLRPLLQADETLKKKSEVKTEVITTKVEETTIAPSKANRCLFRFWKRRASTVDVR